jgi:PadR family transcriptional regulator PadR
MKWPFRITAPLLDVVEALRHAGGPLHGWGIAEETGQSGPNVYRALRRLQDAGWVDYVWEAENPAPGKPRRRLYWLTSEGRRQAGALLADRRGGPALDWSTDLTSPRDAHACRDFE